MGGDFQVFASGLLKPEKAILVSIQKGCKLSKDKYKKELLIRRI